MREYINHFTAARLRVIGAGALKLSFISQDNVKSQVLLPLNMIPANAIEPQRLANFVSQRAIFRMGVTDINEYFEINRIVIYSKTMYTGSANNG